MKYIELQYAFELEAALIDSYNEKIDSQDILYWLNQGVDRFVKTRFSGNNPSDKGFEQTEKRARDLMSLYLEYKPENITVVDKNNYQEYTVDYPEDLLFVVDESVIICPTGNTDKQRHTEIFECTLDNYMYRITNTLTDFHYNNGYARPLRVRTKDGAKLLTDGKYEVVEYKVGYLKKPIKITLDNPFEEYTDLPEEFHNEIVKLAVQMFIENINSPRYQTIQNEVSQME